MFVSNIHFSWQKERLVAVSGELQGSAQNGQEQLHQDHFKSFDLGFYEAITIRYVVLLHPARHTRCCLRFLEIEIGG